MGPVLLMVLHASSPGAAGTPPADFDLKDVVTAERQRAVGGCGSRAPGEIVVCGRRDPDRYRYREQPARPEWIEDGMPRAETELGNGTTGGIELEQVSNPDGTVSKRIMVRVKTKF